MGGDPSVQSPRFGVSEGVGIYLNGSELPNEVYAESDVNVVMDDLAASLGDAGDLRSWWEGPSETALYLYGPSASAIRMAVEPVLSTHPLCEGARVVDLPTREQD